MATYTQIWLKQSFILACFVIASTVRGEIDADQIKVAEFDIKPGGMVQEYEQIWDNFKCKFTYAAQGGTKEQWIVGLTRNSDQTQYSCSIERQGGHSYLFFQQFKMEIEGVELDEAIIEGEGGKPLNPEEYTINTEEKYVAHVEGKFNSQLSKVEVQGTKGHQEL